MNCELNGYEESLGSLASGKVECPQEVIDQAKLLMSPRHGFKETDVFCGDCFWK